MVETADAIGIDLGTTYSCVGVWQDDMVKIIANEIGLNTCPSYVAFTASESMTGDSAKAQHPRNSLNTIYDAKRLIGRKMTEQTVIDDVKLWPFKVEAGEDDKPIIKVQFKGEQKDFHPEEISAMILAHMKELADGFIGKDIKNAVITVPAYFNDAQR